MNNKELTRWPVQTQTPAEFDLQIRDLLLGAIGAKWDGAFNQADMNRLLIAMMTFIVNVTARSGAPLVMGAEIARFLNESVAKAIEFQAQ